VKLYPVAEGQKDELYRLLEMHLKATNSAKAADILQHFEDYLPKFRAVISDEYMKFI
jgi:glutamate synthase (ferredoxin)